MQSGGFPKTRACLFTSRAGQLCSERGATIAYTLHTCRAFLNSLCIQVRRLQELRRYIQEECDQLLLRKERLREEVSASLHHPHATKHQPTHHGKGHRVEEEEEVEEVMVRTVATQAPSSLLGVTHGPSLALSSLAHAYKVDGGCSTHFQTGVPSRELLGMFGRIPI